MITIIKSAIKIDQLNFDKAEVKYEGMNLKQLADMFADSKINVYVMCTLQTQQVSKVKLSGSDKSAKLKVDIDGETKTISAAQSYCETFEKRFITAWIKGKTHGAIASKIVGVCKPKLQSKFRTVFESDQNLQGKFDGDLAFYFRFKNARLDDSECDTLLNKLFTNVKDITAAQSDLKHFVYRRVARALINRQNPTDQSTIVEQIYRVMKKLPKDEDKNTAAKIKSLYPNVKDE
jgi:hypothetical protein